MMQKNLFLKKLSLLFLKKVPNTLKQKQWSFYTLLKKRALTLLCSFFVVLYLVSCFGSSSLQYSLVSPEDLGASVIPNDKFFYVNLHAAYYTGAGYDPLDSLIYSLDEGPGVDCKIPVDAESTEDLYCILDVAEGDLWFHAIELEYNVPEGMCDYLDFYTHWHYNQAAAVGPRYICKCDQVTGSGDNRETKEGYYIVNNRTQCVHRIVSDPPSDPAGDPTVVTEKGCNPPTGANVKDSAEDLCSYNKREVTGLANCCFGEYTVVESRSDSGQNQEWGGDFRQCIGGLGRIAWDSFNGDGVPITLTTNTKKNGLNAQYKIPALIEQYGGAAVTCETSSAQPNLCDPISGTPALPSFITANYWSTADEKNSALTKPKFYKPPSGTNEIDLGHSPLRHEGYPYITWTCMDRNREASHRIHLLIQEWNTKEEFTRFKESGGSQGDPDIEGAEGTECDYYESDEVGSLNFTACNDIWDTDDFEEKGRGYPQINYGGSGATGLGGTPQQ